MSPATKSKVKRSKGEHQPNTGVIKRFGVADAPLRPWRIKEGSSHPWIVESETNVSGHYAELGSFSYKPFAELVAAAPELIYIAELADEILSGTTYVSDNKKSQLEELIRLLNKYKSKATPGILRLLSRKKEAA